MCHGNCNAQNIKIQDSIDNNVLETIIKRGAQTNSDAIVIWKDGELVYENYFGRKRGKIESMSATKSVVALAFGLLLADGKLDSLDQPVHTIYPEWKQGLKEKITIHHLLTHRSGLQCDRRTTKIYQAPDFVQFALAADLVEEPGSAWRYNNKGCNLLPGIVEKISGRRMDELIGERVFKPLGITDWSWSRDKAGNPHGMSGLQIRPEDFAKIGQLMLNHGKWENNQLLPEDFVKRCGTDFVPKPKETSNVEFKGKTPKEVGMALGYDKAFRQNYGLLWWVDVQPEIAITDRLIEHWKANEVNASFLKKAAQLKGLRGEELNRKWNEVIGEAAFFEEIIQKGQQDWDILGWNELGFHAAGYLGQYLVIDTRHNIVAVRMRRTPKGDFDDTKLDSFRDFRALVHRLGVNKN